MKRTIYCCSCERDVTAEPVTGEDIYPGRKDLAEKKFYRCKVCGCYVGCHSLPPFAGEPLGSIPTPELRMLRSKIHSRLDPLWMGGFYSRKTLYQKLSVVVGRTYHTAEIRSPDEAKKVFDALDFLTAKAVRLKLEKAKRRTGSSKQS